MKIKYLNLFYFLFYLLGISFTIILSSCSDLDNNLTSAPELTIHSNGVLDKQSQNFHGRLLLDGTMESCKQCHSSDFSGGIAKVGCNTSQCHPPINIHKEGLTTIGSNNFHGTYIKNSHWNLTQCSQCHGANYTGGIASPSCTTCHTNTNGPEACNTCHGDFNDPNRIAPPRDINGDTSTAILGVGAHSKHLYENSVGNVVSCSDCHKVPDKNNIYSPGHLDSDLPAEVTLSGQAIINGASNAAYNHSDGSCANTYCHGNFTFYKDSTSLRNQFAYTEDKMTGISQTVIWNKVDGSQIKCGSCHGLPPSGHIQVELKDCAGCHTGVIDEFGNIIDKSKHMNGKIDVFGE
jgi:Geobacter CxxxxCH...CXXCH motif (GSu_C4xC__C2xCH)